ncbi:bacteriocin biosynthesis cyclodehydratase domain-containing protein [Mycolicibacterium iranicum]|uniref:Bacteriocin biosynthesis cyclodehydratase domain-containing protein n=1 Tax=Mycolicibacterium iranicum TaxID=912594 RepID=A0A839Q7A8_MYCIR|nr:cyclodehydratase [Mycolicibacterium iranicum]MBB2991393.1 bacteriocin biosynthesis cyclodehydratase domain-containing protein [Mycolicibacterium iranicum]
MTRYALSPTTPVLSRPDGTVQVGWDPRRAVVVRPPTGLSGPVLIELLRTLQDAATAPQLHRLAAGHGVAAAVVDELVSHLAQRGVITSAPRDHIRAASVRVHGSGPLSDLLTASLRCSNVRVSQSTRTNASTARPDLVVLTDYLVADPRLVRDLHEIGMPHMPVRVRDGTGLVGPLVIPGKTSCLRCADLHRSDRDAAWPAVAAQLCHTIGTADRATVLATAALALHQIDHVIRAVRGESTETPSTMDTTLEFDVAHGAIEARRWSRHRNCSC